MKNRAVTKVVMEAPSPWMSKTKRRCGDTVEGDSDGGGRERRVHLHLVLTVLTHWGHAVFTLFP